MSKSDVDVVIVGAGLAGLSAALNLRELGRTFVVLEARDRVGGRTWTQEFPKNRSKDLGEEPTYWIDHGAQWVGTSQTALLELAGKVGVKTFPGFPVKGKVLVSFNKKRYEFELGPGERGCWTSLLLQCFQENAGYDFDEFQAVEIELNKMAKDFTNGNPWESPNAKKWDSMTVQSWMDGHLKTDGAKFIIRNICLQAFASIPSDLSLLHLVFYVHSAGSMEELHTAQTYRLEGGAQGVAVGAARELSDFVKLSNPVRKIKYLRDRVVVTVDNGDVYEAKRVIVTVPPAIVSNINFEPALPPARRQLNQRMPMGTSVKFHLVYEEPFWKAKGYSGVVLSNDHVLPFITDNTNESQEKPGILGGFVEIETGREYLSKSNKEIQELIIKTMEDIYRPIMGEIPKPLAVHVLSWANEEWSGGCYAGVMPPGVWTGYKNTLREPVGNIHWAGTETSPRWFAYMDGAVRSGERVAEEVDDEMDLRTYDDSHIIDPDYIENVLESRASLEIFAVQKMELPMIDKVSFRKDAALPRGYWGLL